MGQEMQNDNFIELPLVKLTKEDVYGAMFTYHKPSELYKDALLKFQTWIMNFAEEQVKPLRDSGLFTDEEVEQIKAKQCVISPMTLTLYAHWLQMEEFVRMSNSEKEKHLLSRLPDRFKARYKGNASCRNAREAEAVEETVEEGGGVEELARRQNISFLEFLKMFGEETRAMLSKNGGKTDG